MIYVIKGTMSGKAYEIDEFDDKEEANQALQEFKDRVGKEWNLWIAKRRGARQ